MSTNFCVVPAPAPASAEPVGGDGIFHRRDRERLDEHLGIVTTSSRSIIYTTPLRPRTMPQETVDLTSLGQDGDPLQPVNVQISSELRIPGSSGEAWSC